MADQSTPYPVETDYELITRREEFYNLLKRKHFNAPRYKAALSGTAEELRRKYIESSQRGDSGITPTFEDFALYVFFDRTTPVFTDGEKEFWEFSDGKSLAVAASGDRDFHAERAVISPEMKMAIQIGEGVESISHRLNGGNSSTAVSSLFPSNTHAKTIASTVVRQSGQKSKALSTEAFYAAIDEAIAALKKEHSGLTVTRDRNELRIREKNIPELFDTFQLSPSKSKPEDAENFLYQCVGRAWESRQTYNTQRDLMEDGIGLAVTQNDSQTTYQVPGISDCLVIDLKNGKRTESVVSELKKLEDTIIGKHNRRCERLEALCQKGFVADIQLNGEGRPELTLSHPNLEGWGIRTALMTPAFKIAEEGPVSDKCLVSDQAATLIKKAEEASLQASLKPAPAVKTEPVTAIPNGAANGKYHSMPQDNTHSNGKTDLVFDNSMLSLLNGRRTGGKNWQSILKVLETLPNINLVSPSWDADFEFACIVPNHLNQFMATERHINPKPINAVISDHKRFFSAARRHGYNNDGQVFYRSGRPNGFYVWENQKQRELYQELENKLEGIDKTSDEYEKRLHDFREQNKNMGEQFAYDYCQSPQCGNPAIILANDVEFSRKFNPYNVFGFKKLTTSKGRGISVCCGKDFIEALNKAFDGKLADEINRFGGKEANTDYRTIIDSYNTLNSKKSPHQDKYLFPYFTGKTREGIPETRLEEVLREGIRLRQEKREQKMEKQKAMGTHTREQAGRSAAPSHQSWASRG